MNYNLCCPDSQSVHPHVLIVLLHAHVLIVLLHVHVLIVLLHLHVLIVVLHLYVLIVLLHLHILIVLLYAGFFFFSGNAAVFLIKVCVEGFTNTVAFWTAWLTIAL